MSWLSRGADALLERSIVGSFTRLGIVARSRLFSFEPLVPNALLGRVVVISGATSGLGRAAAERFVQLGAHVEIIARNAEKAEETCATLRGPEGKGQVGYCLADMADLVAVRKVAADLRRRHRAIQVLIHNAGALDDTHRTNAAGMEQTVASQVLGPFLLTHLLTPVLQAGAPARVLWVSSGGMYSEALSVDKLVMSAEEYDGVTAYARAKRAQVSLAALWADKLKDHGVHVHAMHPGWADTPGVSRSLPRFYRFMRPLLRTAAEGVDTLVWLSVAEDALLAKGGSFWLDRQPREIHRLARTRRAETAAERSALWRWVAAQCGLQEVAGQVPCSTPAEG